MKNNLIKTPPHSLEAEQSVLGGLMLDNQAWDKVTERLREKDFYLQKHQIIFNALQDLANRGEPFDVITLSELLKINNKLPDAGGEVYLFEIARNTPTAVNIAAYADIVRERSIQRQIITITSELHETAFNPTGKTTSDLLDEAERKIFLISDHKKRGQGPHLIARSLKETLAYIDTLSESDNPITGLSTGYKDLDKITCGLQTSDLIIIAGRPSMGKTTLAMNIVETVAVKNKKPVLFFSMEMSSQQIDIRFLSSIGRVDQQKLRTGNLDEKDVPKVTFASGLLSGAPIYVDDTGALTPGELRSRARRIVREHGHLSLIVVDHLQLMRIQGAKENRTNEISEISRSLKALAKELNVPIILLSQLNRSLEQRADKRPIMSDLRDSGGIEQDADLIIFIHRDEVYNEMSEHKGSAELIIAKQRNGDIGKVKLTFLGKYTRFENFTSGTYELTPPSFASRYANVTSEKGQNSY